MSELDVIGVVMGTDKSSSAAMSWDYLRHYEEFFAKWRHSPINLIEIGIATGASLAVWERYFDRATLVGVDINPDGRSLARERVAIRIGSQDDPGFLHSVAVEFPPTIIIDDGAHVAHMMITSFETLFPALLPGGIYIFEDLSLHFEESPLRFEDAKTHQGLAKMHVYDYLNQFIRARASYVDSPQKAWGFARYAFEHIDSVTVAGGFIAIRKKSLPDFDRAMALLEQELAQTNQKFVVAQRYAEFLFKHNTNLDRAAALLTEIYEHQPDNEANSRILMNVLLGAEQWDQAASVAYRLVELSPDNLAYWDQLAGIERRRNRPDLEIAAAKRIAALQPNVAGFQLRLSELSHMLGDLPAALAAAKRACELEPANPDFRNRLAALETPG